MEYQEFCEGVDVKIEYATYERVNSVYMEYECFETKEQFFCFFKQHGMRRVLEMSYFLESLPGVRTLASNRETYSDLTLEHELLERKLRLSAARLINAGLLCGALEA